MKQLQQLKKLYHDVLFERDRSEKRDGLCSGPISRRVTTDVTRFAAVRVDKGAHVLNEPCQCIQKI